MKESGMNTLKLSLAAILMTFAIGGCRKNTTAYETKTISAPTMICGTCAKTIEKAVYRVEGVNEVKADPDKKIVEVKYNPVQTNLEFIQSAIAAAGYDADDKKRDPDAYEKLDACCKLERK